MTISGGCGNKIFVRIGEGNLKSVFVLLIMGLTAYLMATSNLYPVVFQDWTTIGSIKISDFGDDNQSVGGVLKIWLPSIDSLDLNFIFYVLFLFILFNLLIKNNFFVKANKDHYVGGLVVGLAVVASWYLTGGELGLLWVEEQMFADVPQRGVGMQSFAFTSSMSNSVSVLIEQDGISLITYAIMLGVGVIVGSAIYALTSHAFHLEWFHNCGEAWTYVKGGVLMGAGASLAMGCTFGQGITGMSTLAIGSFITMASIIAGSALTMKTQYFLMMSNGSLSECSAICQSVKYFYESLIKTK